MKFGLHCFLFELMGSNLMSMCILKYEHRVSSNWEWNEILSFLQSVLGIILGGGAGTRLYPLTKKRAKPAVPLGANYRLIDIPVSNCLNSNISKIYVLTQFNSASLNRHLSRAYASNLGGYKNEGFVEVLAAQQSPENPNWFQVMT